jgi:hypothetical protein
VEGKTIYTHEECLALIDKYINRFAEEEAAIEMEDAARGRGKCPPPPPTHRVADVSSGFFRCPQCDGGLSILRLQSADTNHHTVRWWLQWVCVWHADIIPFPSTHTPPPHMGRERQLIEAIHPRSNRCHLTLHSVTTLMTSQAG